MTSLTTVNVGQMFTTTLSKVLTNFLPHTTHILLHTIASVSIFEIQCIHNDVPRAQS